MDVPVFYDPMISKLVAWAEDRPRAVARMRRAVDEYLVTGISTTLPFFRWLLNEPSFIDGRFHTSYLDDELKARGGRPFSQATDSAEELAAIATALQAVLSPAALQQPVNGTPSAASRWRTQARLEGLRRGAPRES